MKCNVKKGMIHYEVVGEGFPIVILHSMGTDHRSMRAWIEPIFKEMSGFQRIYADLPAHGGSTVDKSVHDTDDMMMNILDFIDQALAEQCFSIIGFSFGGYIAQGILSERTAQVRSICLLAPVLHLQKRNLPAKEIIDRDEELLQNLETPIREPFEALLTIQNIETLDMFLSEIQPGRLLADTDFLSSGWRDKGYFLKDNPIREYTLPTLFILGKQDCICGYKDQLGLVDYFQRASFAILDGAGHMLPIEKRHLVQELVKDWVRNAKGDKKLSL